MKRTDNGKRMPRNIARAIIVAFMAVVLTAGTIIGAAVFNPWTEDSSTHPATRVGTFADLKAALADETIYKITLTQRIDINENISAGDISGIKSLRLDTSEPTHIHHFNMGAGVTADFGDKVVLDGNGKAGGVTVSGQYSFTLKNVYISDVVTADAVIFARSDYDTTTTLDGVKVYNSQIKRDGGQYGLVYDAGYGTFEIVNSEFTGNKAAGSGALSSGVMGNANIVVGNSKFDGNSGGYGTIVHLAPAGHELTVTGGWVLNTACAAGAIASVGPSKTQNIAKDVTFSGNTPLNIYPKPPVPVEKVTSAPFLYAKNGSYVNYNGDLTFVQEDVFVYVRNVDNLTNRGAEYLYVLLPYGEEPDADTAWVSNGNEGRSWYIEFPYASQPKGAFSAYFKIKNESGDSNIWRTDIGFGYVPSLTLKVTKGATLNAARAEGAAAVANGETITDDAVFFDVARENGVTYEISDAGKNNWRSFDNGYAWDFVNGIVCNQNHTFSYDLRAKSADGLYSEVKSFAVNLEIVNKPEFIGFDGDYAVTVNVAGRYVTEDSGYFLLGSDHDWARVNITGAADFTFTEPGTYAGVRYFDKYGQQIDIPTFTVYEEVTAPEATLVSATATATAKYVGPQGSGYPEVTIVITENWSDGSTKIVTKVEKFDGHYDKTQTHTFEYDLYDVKMDIKDIGYNYTIDNKTVKVILKGQSEPVPVTLTGVSATAATGNPTQPGGMYGNTSIPVNIVITEKYSDGTTKTVNKTETVTFGVWDAFPISKTYDYGTYTVSLQVTRTQQGFYGQYNYSAQNVSAALKTAAPVWGSFGFGR